MRHRAYPMRGLGQPIPTGNPLAATCWSDELNEQIIAACDAKSPVCSMENVSRLLSLPFCPGSGPSATVPGGAARVPPGEACTPGYSIMVVGAAGLIMGVAGYYLAMQD